MKMLRLQVLVLLWTVSACGGGDAPQSGNGSGPDVQETTYEVQGAVTGVTADSTYLTVAHEEIPGYMDAMTMPFVVEDTARLPRLSVGDSIRFTLVSGRSGDRIHSVRTIE